MLYEQYKHIDVYPHQSQNIADQIPNKISVEVASTVAFHCNSVLIAVQDQIMVPFPPIHQHLQFLATI
jgi:hypothetical protein